MVIYKDSKNKNSLYLKYIKDIIRSLEENPGDWSLNTLSKTFDKYSGFYIILNLEKKNIDILERRINSIGKMEFVTRDRHFSQEMVKDEYESVLEGLMISNILILKDLLAVYYEEDDFENTTSVEWIYDKDLERTLIPILKNFLFDSIFSGRFKKIDVEKWFGFQKDIIFSDSVSVKSILGKERIPEYLKNNFDKRIVEIIENDSFD
jgi:hypothetical protein